MPRTVLVAFGTRPEAIKMAPVVRRLRERPDDFKVVTVATAQHREMLDRVLEVFDIAPDFDLNVMRQRQDLGALTSRLMDGISPVIEEVRPDVVLVQGDTTTTFMTALAAFYHRVPIGHIEAGLRTGRLDSPFPEEANRRLTSVLTHWHFAPTATAESKLLAEGVDPARITVTGNTVIDALLEAAEKPYTFEPGPIADLLARGRRLVLLTAHRRESWGAPLLEVCRAVRRIAAAFDDVDVLFAVHPNPEVRDAAEAELRGADRVLLTGPVDYLPFVKLMQASTLILSDSGGIQEEAPSFGKPVLVLRDVTERSEAVEAGTVRLVGRDAERIAREATLLLGDAAAYAEMATRANPFGDGNAARRIADVLAAEL
jgi:UDP-N-acetylglucosamine 2-epimerase (non-hydrolysing)